MLEIQVPSSGRPGTVHTVKLNTQTGLWDCSCESWRFQAVPAGFPRTCKHINALARELSNHAISAQAYRQQAAALN